MLNLVTASPSGSSTFLNEHPGALLVDAKIQVAMVQYQVQHFDPEWLKCGYVDRQIVQHAVIKRQAEYVAGRYCANRALNQLLAVGQDYVIGKGEHGQPLWPTGVVGSIAHSHDVAIAVVSHTAKWLGVDCEEVMSTSTAQQIASMIAKPQELALLSQLDQPFNYLLSLLFSAKESIYKAIYPSVKKVLDFDMVKLIQLDVKNEVMTFEFHEELEMILKWNKEISVKYFNVNKRKVTNTICTLVCEFN